MANMGCKLAKISSMLKMGMAGIGFLGSAYATLESVENGNAQQAGFRFILTVISGIGLKRAVGEGVNTVRSNYFIAGTLVLTENGNKPIEEIQVGDKVLAENPETGEQEYKEVVQVFENETDELVHISINDETITTTPTHPFYVPQRGWINAIDLKSGDILVLSNGEYVTVEQVQHEILETPVKIYNFEVEDFHTYYVGENSVLVHNLGCGGDRYTKIHYEGKTKVGGIERDVSRDMYLRNDIDWNRIDIASGLTNKELAKKGLAPFANDGTKIELHHLLQQEPGAMVEIPGSLHKKYYSALHGMVGKGGSFRNNPVLNKQYNSFRKQYWKWRASNLD